MTRMNSRELSVHMKTLNSRWCSRAVGPHAKWRSFLELFGAISGRHLTLIPP